jgi:integrase
MRILLALGTGLRRGDIESLRATDIDFENSYVTTRSKKTRKSMGSRPVPVLIMEELNKYVSGLNPEQEKIFSDRFNQYRWDKIRKKLGLGDFIFHDLRNTLALCLLRTVYPLLLHRDCWSTHHRILQTRYIRMLTLSCDMQ